jgi:response regulator NasT
VSSDFLESDVSHQVFGVLSKPIREAELAAMILVAAQRSTEFNQLRAETSSLRTALEDRKVIEQAKGVLMMKCDMDEANAFRQLQHMARQQRKKVVEIAHSVLIAESAFEVVHKNAVLPRGDAGQSTIRLTSSNPSPPADDGVLG